MSERFQIYQANENDAMGKDDVTGVESSKHRVQEGGKSLIDAQNRMFIDLYTTKIQGS